MVPIVIYLIEVRYFTIYIIWYKPCIFFYFSNNTCTWKMRPNNNALRKYTSENCVSRMIMQYCYILHNIAVETYACLKILIKRWNSVSNKIYKWFVKSLIWIALSKPKYTMKPANTKNEKLWRTDMNILYLWRDIPLLCMHKKSLIWTKFTQILKLLICYCTYNFETVYVYSCNLNNSKFLSENV